MNKIIDLKNNNQRSRTW